jgi:hypothetical protein
MSCPTGWTPMSEHFHSQKPHLYCCGYRRWPMAHRKKSSTSYDFRIGHRRGGLMEMWITQSCYPVAVDGGRDGSSPCLAKQP